MKITKEIIENVRQKSEEEQFEFWCNALIKGSGDVSRELSNISLLLINIKIALARLKDNPDARAMDKADDIISESVKGIEESIKGIPLVAKRLLELNNELVNKEKQNNDKN